MGSQESTYFHKYSTVSCCTKGHKFYYFFPKKKYDMKSSEQIKEKETSYVIVNHYGNDIETNQL